MTAARSALITGASRGIGLSIARRLASQGYCLTLAARNQEDLDGVAAQLRAEFGVDARGVAADLSRPEDLAHLVQSHVDTSPGLDALVLNGGVGLLGGVERADRERLDNVFQINFTSALLLFQHALPALRATAANSPGTGARVIALASILGVYPQPKLGGYAASKAALRSLMESINLEHSSAGINATAICPAYVATDMTTWLEDSITAESMIAASDIAELVASLLALSPRAVVNEIVVSRAGTDGRMP